MYFFIQVSKDSENRTVDDNFDHDIIPGDRFSDFQSIPLSEVIRQRLFIFNRQKIFDPQTFTLFEDSYWFAYAICEGSYSYSFCCYRIFDCAAEVLDFQKTFSSDVLIQQSIFSGLQDVFSRFSTNPAYMITALDVKELVEDILEKSATGLKDIAGSI